MGPRSLFLAALALLARAALAEPAWKLAWSDEFNGPANAAPDPKAWAYDLGGDGWGNHEAECYTDKRDNSYLDGEGHLVLQALRRPTTGKDGIRRDYSSARLLTRGLERFSQGYIEARIQLPYGQGIWPAFWMLGDNIGQRPWPACGEIDIMEHLGKEPSSIHGTAHGPGYSGMNGKGAAFNLPAGARFKDAFHTFAIEWSPAGITWLVDRQRYHTVTPADLGGKEWVFDKPFFLLLNLAVGGDWPGQPDRTSSFPQKMLVDYVRVYSR